MCLDLFARAHTHTQTHTLIKNKVGFYPQTYEHVEAFFHRRFLWNMEPFSMVQPTPLSNSEFISCHWTTPVPTSSQTISWNQPAVARCALKLVQQVVPCAIVCHSGRTGGFPKIFIRGGSKKQSSSNQLTNRNLASWKFKYSTKVNNKATIMQII